MIQAVQEQNVQVAAGIVGSAPQPKNQPFEYTAFVEGRLASEKAFGDIIVKTNPADGSLVYLKDVARIELGKFNYSGGSFVDVAGFIFCTARARRIPTSNRGVSSTARARSLAP